MSSVKIVITHFDLDDIGDDMESLVSAAIQLTDAHDENRWTLGDIGAKVERNYGEGGIKTWVGKVKKIRSSVAYDYIRLSKFYPDEHRAAFPSLSWSHYREAERLMQDKESRYDLEDSLNALSAAADNDWSVDELKRHINALIEKPEPPVKVLDGDAVLIVIGENDLTFAIEPPSGMKVGRRYRIKVYEYDEEDESEVEHAEVIQPQ